MTMTMDCSTTTTMGHQLATSRTTSRGPHATRNDLERAYLHGARDARGNRPPIVRAYRDPAARAVYLAGYEAEVGA